MKSQSWSLPKPEQLGAATSAAHVRADGRSNIKKLYKDGVYWEV